LTKRESLEALELEAFGGLMIGGPWRLYNWRPLEALYLEGLGSLIIGGPRMHYNWNFLKAL
jgi:hypothetical protein